MTKVNCTYNSCIGIKIQNNKKQIMYFTTKIYPIIVFTNFFSNIIWFTAYHKKRNGPKQFKHFWKIKNKGQQPVITWEKANPYVCDGMRCN